MIDSMLSVCFTLQRAARSLLNVYPVGMQSCMANTKKFDNASSISRLIVPQAALMANAIPLPALIAPGPRQRHQWADGTW